VGNEVILDPMVDMPPDLPQWVALGGGSAWVAKKLLGESLDVVGEALARWTSTRLDNVERIMHNAAGKSRTGLGDPATVPARVAMRIFEEGSYSDDDVVIEYLGGVLASSRTQHGRDDRGNTWTRLVAGLSTYELRCHYVCYRLLREHVSGREDINLHDMAGVANLGIYISHAEMDDAMAFSQGENPAVLRDHSDYGLMRERLLAGCWTGSSVEGIQRVWPDAPAPGSIYRPSTWGVLLYMWAHGAGNMDLNLFLDPTCQLDFVDVELALPQQSTLLHPLGEGRFSTEAPA
jgi:hypothetical protein